jgi:F-type H+-transporting ATPase subunit epsilon
MSSLIVTILSPEGLAYEGEVLEAYFPSAQGPLGILPGHTPYIAELAVEGVIRIKETNGNLRYFGISRGALEVRPDKSIALTDVALSAKSEEEALMLLKSRSTSKLSDTKDVERGRAALEAQTKK